jgi:hypothetical protein
MTFPEPQLGLVISYAYLWHHEHRAGRDEGVKDRPCVIVLAVQNAGNSTMTVRVAPVTHSPPDNPATAVELPPAVKRHLGLDDYRSWIVMYPSAGGRLVRVKGWLRVCARKEVLMSTLISTAWPR